MAETKIGVHKAWRTIAISLIIILVLLLFLYYIGYKQVSVDQENEKKCVLSICDNDLYTSYYYNINTKMCTCYNENEKLKEVYLG